MLIKKETGVYNEKRYSKPWIAKIDFSVNKNGEFLWGTWIGQHGFRGILELDNINEGDIVAIGQKDHRVPRNSSPTFYIVKNGELEKTTKIEAYEHFINSK